MSQNVFSFSILRISWRGVCVGGQGLFHLVFFYLPLFSKFPIVPKGTPAIQGFLLGGAKLAVPLIFYTFVSSCLANFDYNDFCFLNI